MGEEDLMQNGFDLVDAADFKMKGWKFITAAARLQPNGKSTVYSKKRKRRL